VIVKVPSVAGGVNKDAQPEELALGVWSDALNVSFDGGHMKRAPGITELFTDASEIPYALWHMRTATKLLWIHAGLDNVFADDGSARTTITRAAGVYTGTAANRWTGGVLNGLLVINNGVEKPQYWNGDTATDLADLPNWTANKLAKVIRPWRNWLFALDVTTAGTRFPYRVLWSSAADPGTYPASWDVASASSGAGEVDLAETGGLLVDALPMGDQLIIYSHTSMYAVRFIGGQSIFSFARLPGEVGMLTRCCAANTPLGHVVLTSGDVILHSGQGPRSIASGRVRRAIFDSMYHELAEQASFVVPNPTANEVWICYPEGAAGTACTKAAIWNWVDDTWTFRTLANATCGAVGAHTAPADDTWTTASGTWATETVTWGSAQTSPNESHLVLGHVGLELGLVGYGTTALGASFTSTAERTGLSLDDPQRVKMVRSVFPRIDATLGTVIQVQIGASNTPDVTPTYSPAQDFTAGTSEKVDAFCAGKYLAYKVSSSADAAWRLRGMDFDVVGKGRW
jgi:hypothetical protein